MYVKRVKNKVIGKVNELRSNSKCREISEKYQFNNYKRIYNIHIRKTGGTSLNNMFLGLADGNTTELYQQLVDKPEHRICVNDYIYVGWNKALINKGDYFYAFSHIPYHELNLQPDTYTITCFRDPVKRIVSHYFMLLDWVNEGVYHPSLAIEADWLGDSFDDFIRNMDREHLFNQLYMFSKKLNVDQALSGLSDVSQVMFTEDFNSGIDSINQQIGLGLESIHVRKSTKGNIIKQSSLDDLREILEKEYVFLEQVKEVL